MHIETYTDMHHVCNETHTDDRHEYIYTEMHTFTCTQRYMFKEICTQMHIYMIHESI